MQATERSFAGSCVDPPKSGHLRKTIAGRLAIGSRSGRLLAARGGALHPAHPRCAASSYRVIADALNARDGHLHDSTARNALRHSGA
jgi:hypothetical protein